MTVLVHHTCGLVSDYATTAEAAAELREMYPGARIDESRALVWADDSGMPVAEIVIRDPEVVR